MTAHSESFARETCARLMPMGKPLAAAAIIGGILGGLAMITIMILDMGIAGMGYASPLNIGMAAFVYTITPPMSMLPMLMTTMGGHATPAMMAAMQALQSGHASNSTVASLMSSMDTTTRNSVMVNMPVTTSHVVAGTVLHFAFSAFVGGVFAVILMAAARLRLPAMNTVAGLTIAGGIGGALLYVVMRWAILPSVNPMMANVPQGAFFLAHVAYGLVVGMVTGIVVARAHVVPGIAVLPGRQPALPRTAH